MSRINRRVLLRSMAGAGAALALSACAAPTPVSPTAPGAANPTSPAQPTPTQAAGAAAKPGATQAAAAPTTAPAPAAAPTETPKKGGTLVVGLEAEPGTLDNSVGTGYHTSIVQRLVYESLVGYDLTSTADVLPIKPVLAESWQISPDGKVYTFKLRQGIKFH